MHKYIPGEWLRAQDKRALSLLDKHTLPSYENYALVMPGEPGTEFEELSNAGFDQSKIICVDNTSDDFLLENLTQVYGEQFINGDVFEVVENSSREFSYMHFDMCSTTHPDIPSLLVRASKKLTPSSRLRYSGVRTTRGVYAKSRMSKLKENYKDLSSYCLRNLKQEKEYRFWARAAKACLNADDEAGAIVSKIFCTSNLNISSVYKKHYLGNNMCTNMFTFWIDTQAEPLQEEQKMKVVDAILSTSQTWKAE